MLHSLVTEDMSFTNTGFDREEGEGVEGGNTWQAEIIKNRSSPMERGVDSEVMGGKGGKENICVIGSGDFGRALAGRLATAGYKVTIASRDPDRNR